MGRVLENRQFMRSSADFEPPGTVTRRKTTTYRGKEECAAAEIMLKQRQYCGPVLSQYSQGTVCQIEVEEIET